MAAMGLQHRARIMELRSQIDPDTIGKPGSPNGRIYSVRKIAAMLGVTPGVVEKEMYRDASRGVTAREAQEAAGAGGLGAPGIPAMLPMDPGLAELQSEQLEIRRLQLQAQRMKAQRELELLSKAPGDSSGALMLVIDKLGNLASRIDQIAGLVNRSPAAAVTPAPTGIEYLTQLRRGWEAVKTIGGETKPPSTEAELQATIALRRLNMEAEERQRRLDEEIEERRIERKNSQIRAEAIAQQIGQWGPLLAQGAQGWLAQQQNGGPTAPAGPGGEEAALSSRATASSRPALAVLEGQAAQAPLARTPQGPNVYVEGRCPSCGAPLGIHPGPDDRCPKCNLALAVVNGRIMPKMPKSNSEHFAS